MKPIARVTLHDGRILEFYAEMAGNMKRLFVKGPFKIGPGNAEVKVITEFTISGETVKWTEKTSGGGLQTHEQGIKMF